MDQDAFRKLLATPRTAPIATAASTSDSWREGHGASGSRKPKASKPAFKPRGGDKGAAKDGKSGKEGKEGGGKKKERTVLPPGYRDRAAERREGQDHEFTEAEKLIESQGLDRETAETQRAFLGGDAEHSIAVKGLDMSLLAAERAKLERLPEAEAERALEDAFEGVEGEADDVEAAPAVRSRDDILRDLMAKHGSSTAEADALLKAKAEGKFRRVGDKPTPAPASKADAAVRTVVGADGKVKKLRKKKKPAEPTASTSAPAPVVKAEPAAPAPPPPPPAPEPVEDDLDDLFGGTVAPYQRPTYDDSDSDEAKPAAQPKPSNSAATDVKPAKRVQLFDEDDADLRADPITAPELPKLPPPTAKGKGKARAKEQEDADAPERLQPLASTAVSDIRALLDLDAAEAKAEERRERKQARKVEAEGGMPGDAPPKKKKQMTEKDKLNRDFQAYEQYEAKKKRKREGKEEEEDPSANDGV